MRNSDYPVETPLLTGALVDKIHELNIEAGRRPKAHDTRFRYSDAGGCLRKIGYESMGVDHSDPADLAGEWVMWLGSDIHESVQLALIDLYGERCLVEATSRHDDLCSGHADAFVILEDGRKVVYELKTKGSFGFDKAIGLRRKDYRTEIPEGPGMAAKLQGALNAAAFEADLLVIGVIAMEAVSKQLAERVGINARGRIMAEWHYDVGEWGPWAKAELDRLQGAADCLDAKVLPYRMAIGDEGENVFLDPEASRPPWQCVYCPFRDTCIWDGKDPVEFGRAR